MDVDNADHLFGNPWKHFNLGDVLNDGVGGEHPRQGERQREDDDDGDGEVLVDVSDSEAGDDAQRASGILSAIIEGNAQGECPYTAGGGADVDMEKLRLYIRQNVTSAESSIVNWSKWLKTGNTDSS